MNNTQLFSLVKSMSQTRVLALLTVIWLTVLLNIERLDLNTTNAINISNATYLLIAIIGIAYLAFPNLERVEAKYSVPVVIGMYFILNIIFYPFWIYRNTLLTITEIFTILITLAIMSRISRVLLNFEISLRSFVFDKETSRVQEDEEGSRKIEEELERASRFKYSTAILFCAVYDPTEAEKEEESSFISIDWDSAEPFKSRYYQVQLAHSISTLAHWSDTIVEYGDDIVVCLAQTDQEDAERFVHQLNWLLKHTMNVNLLAGIACAPADGYTFRELVQSARSNIRVYADISTAETNTRTGDVMVSLNERLNFMQASAWVDKYTYQSPSSRLIYAPIKRFFDIIAITLTLPVIVPVFALIGLIIYMDDGFPIFYKQPRTGYGGKRFSMYKFRSMRVDAKTIQPTVITLPNGEVRYEWPKKDGKDPRITRIGHFIRKASIDELPQLWNILIGDMSVVGPRPTTWDVEMYTLHQTERLTVRPGLTGLWQVCARETTNFDERLLWDLKYVEKMCFELDMQIVWRTVAQVFARKGK